MKRLYYLVSRCGDTNYGMELSESRIRCDYSITDEDKEAILRLDVNEIHYGTFTVGKPFACKRLS